MSFLPKDVDVVEWDKRTLDDGWKPYFIGYWYGNDHVVIQILILIGVLLILVKISPKVFRWMTAEVHLFDLFCNCQVLSHDDTVLCRPYVTILCCLRILSWKELWVLWINTGSLTSHLLKYSSILGHCFKTPTNSFVLEHL